MGDALLESEAPIEEPCCMDACIKVARAYAQVDSGVVSKLSLYVKLRRDSWPSRCRELDGRTLKVCTMPKNRSETFHIAQKQHEAT
jgi:hypothetical protein